MRSCWLFLIDLTSRTLHSVRSAAASATGRFPGDCSTPESESGVSDDGDYWISARRPLCSLAFVAPLVLFYEAGVLLLGGNQADSLRNGADFWMRSLLNPFGSFGPWLLPILVGAALLGWHAIRDFRWRVDSQTLLGMSAESLLYASCLIVLGQASDLCFQRLHTVAVASSRVDSPGHNSGTRHHQSVPYEQTAAAAGKPTRQETSRRHRGENRQVESQIAERKSDVRSTGDLRSVSTQADGHDPLAPWLLAVSFVGAGVYEEALFRLWMLPALYLVLLGLQLPKTPALYGAIFASSLLFTIAHYIGAGADRYDTFTFTFRLLAGHCFAALFLARGFGIAAGTHAMYDLLVGVLLRPV